MTQEHVPVLIVGAGGAGLSLTLLLLQQGIPSLLDERRPDISWYPRARNLNFHTMEVFRGLGLEVEVSAAGTRVSRIFRKENLASRWSLRLAHRHGWNFLVRGGACGSR
jgi:putative polyketide hydroxylase